MSRVAGARRAGLDYPSFPQSPVDLPLGSDGNLWLEQTPFGHVPPSRHRVDTSVQTFQSLDEHTVFVLGNDGTLLLEQGSFGTPAATKQQIDRNVVNFQALDSQNIIVLGSDAKLWLERAPFGTVPPARSLVDVNIRGFQASDAQNVLVVDRKDNLWHDQAPFGSLPPTHCADSPNPTSCCRHRWRREGECRWRPPESSARHYDGRSRSGACRP